MTVTVRTRCVLLTTFLAISLGWGDDNPVPVNDQSERSFAFMLQRSIAVSPEHYLIAVVQQAERPVCEDNGPEPVCKTMMRVEKVLASRLPEGVPSSTLREFRAITSEYYSKERFLVVAEPFPGTEILYSFASMESATPENVERFERLLPQTVGTPVEAPSQRK